MFPIYEIFDKLENKDDIFRYINNKTTPKNVHIMYKTYSKEGLIVKLAQPSGEICRTVFVQYGTSYKLESNILEDLEFFNFINSHDINFQLFRYFWYFKTYMVFFYFKGLCEGWKKNDRYVDIQSKKINRSNFDWFLGVTVKDG